MLATLLNMAVRVEVRVLAGANCPIMACNVITFAIGIRSIVSCSAKKNGPSWRGAERWRL